MRRFVLVASVICSSSLMLAQTASVSRNVNLRPDPSTDNDPIEKLKPPAQVTLVEAAPTNGFYHVTAPDGQDGWVWGKNVSVQQAPPPAPPSDHGQPDNSAPADALSPNWDKPAPTSSILHGDEGDCAETGDGGDADTNLRKNRIDVPDTYNYVKWDAINGLDYPKTAPKSRQSWSASQLQVIAPYEGEAIRVDGYLYKLKVESTSPGASHGGESTNCHFRLANDVDWHMPLTANQGDGEDVAIVVETTPRIRQQHPNWTPARLLPWTEMSGSHANSQFNGQKIRISGWLMLDPEHQKDMVEKGLRSTLWEIHPITKIEVMKDGTWVDLDSLP
jgi:hypothetical protein